jgi:hypothetical protein
MDSFDGDLETAQMRLRNLAEAACKVLDANILNLASFHLCAYMDVALKYKGRLEESMVRDLANEQLNAVATREAKQNAGASLQPVRPPGETSPPCEGSRRSQRESKG